MRDLPYGLAQVTGNSMNAHEPVSIDDKDYILFQRTTNSQNGDIVVASRPIQSSGEDAYMVKKYNKIDQLLVSETNDTLSPYPDVKLNKDHQILGIVIAVAKPV